MIVLASLTHGRCCCCCGGAGVVRSNRVVSALGAVVAASDSSSGIPIDPDGPMGWRKFPQAGKKYTIPLSLYLRLPPRPEVPVISRSRCGNDRDCIPDDRERPSFSAALPPAYGWISVGNGRFVDVVSKDGQSLLAHIQGSGADYVNLVSSSADEAEMKMIQRSPNAGRYGFLPL
jgi:hypothetical protein